MISTQLSPFFRFCVVMILCIRCVVHIVLEIGYFTNRTTLQIWHKDKKKIRSKGKFVHDRLYRERWAKPESDRQIFSLLSLSIGHPDKHNKNKTNQSKTEIGLIRWWKNYTNLCLLASGMHGVRLLLRFFSSEYLHTCIHIWMDMNSEWRINKVAIFDLECMVQRNKKKGITKFITSCTDWNVCSFFFSIGVFSIFFLVNIRTSSV